MFCTPGDVWIISSESSDYFPQEKAQEARDPTVPGYGWAVSSLLSGADCYYPEKEEQASLGAGEHSQQIANLSAWKMLKAFNSGSFFGCAA